HILDAWEFIRCFAMGDKPSRQLDQEDISSKPDYQLLIDAFSAEKASQPHEDRQSYVLPSGFPDYPAGTIAERRELHMTNGTRSVADAKDMIAKLPEGDKVKVENAMDKLRWSDPSNREHHERELLQTLGPDISAKIVEAKSEYRNAYNTIKIQNGDIEDINSRTAKLFSKSAISCHQSARMTNDFELQIPRISIDDGEKIWKKIDPIYEKANGIRKESIPAVDEAFTEAALTMFPRLDINSDGKLSKFELATALKDQMYKDENAQVVGALYMQREEISQLGVNKSNGKTISRENIKTIDEFLATQDQNANDFKVLLDFSAQHKENRFKALFPREDVAESLKNCQDERTANALNEALEKIPDGPLSYEKLVSIWKDQLSDDPKKSLIRAVDDIRLVKKFLKSNPELLKDGVLDADILHEYAKHNSIDSETKHLLNTLMTKNGGSISESACAELMGENNNSADSKLLRSTLFLLDKNQHFYFESSDITSSTAYKSASQENRNAIDRMLSHIGTKIDQESLNKFLKSIDSDPIAETISAVNRICRKAAFSQEKNDCYDLYGPGGADENINADAVNQSSFGNCYLAAALSSVAESRPGIISQMIKQNSDSTYTVTFRGDPKHPITVSHPTEAMLGIGMEATKYGVWPRVIEEAFGEHCRRYDKNAKEKYSPLDLEVSGNGGNPATVLRLLTGSKYALVPLKDIKDLNHLVDVLKVRSEPTVLSINKAQKAQSEGFATSHAYTLRVRPDVALLRVRNPWGGADNTVKGNMEINADRIRRNFDGITIPIR
ncbi:MAG: hypothetical protein K2X81_27915, partial [Candidatus Obscuribacterales bacterium]|nr:hypothetical protein [Candidatus Obscuribacterales bacterium]